MADQLVLTDDRYLRRYLKQIRRKRYRPFYRSAYLFGAAAALWLLALLFAGRGRLISSSYMQWEWRLPENQSGEASVFRIRFDLRQGRLDIERSVTEEK